MAEVDGGGLAAGGIVSPQRWNERSVRVGVFKPGDLVRTPLGRIARIVACRADGHLDAQYVGMNPWTADTILQTHLLTKLDEHGNPISLRNIRHLIKGTTRFLRRACRRGGYQTLKQTLPANAASAKH